MFTLQIELEVEGPGDWLENATLKQKQFINLQN